ncbi:hypothetical protein I4U23_029470 [Adineta vaga]|nr:hypothetical protein I4U23_029470 [Adineta vaga]
MSITQALKAYTQTRNLQSVLTIHRHTSFRVETDTSISTSLIHLYMQCGDVISAASLFDASRKKTLFMYATMMKGYVIKHTPDKAIDLYKEMKNPEEVIIIVLFNVFSQLENSQMLEVVKNVSKQKFINYFFSNLRLTTSLFDSLIKREDCSNAEIIFPNVI